MPWLNFTEGINSLKGQLSNLTSGVLTEGIVNTENSPLAEDFEKPPSDDVSYDVQEKILNKKLQESPDTTTKDEIISDLLEKVTKLEYEKTELTLSLEQLDLDCQQTTDKLLTLKDTVQIEYDDLKKDFEILKKEHGLVLNKNTEKPKEDLENEELTKLRNENSILNEKLTLFLKEDEEKNLLVEKFNELKKQCDNHLGSLFEEKQMNVELQKLYNNLEEVNAALTEKLKEYVNFTVPNELIKECGATIQTTNLASQENSLIEENEELCATIDYENIIIKDVYDTTQVKVLKDELEETQKLCDSQKKTNEELCTKIEEDSVEIEALKQMIKKFTNDCEVFQNDKENMNLKIVQLTNDYDNLNSNCESLKSLKETLDHDYHKLKASNEELIKTTNDLEMFVKTPAYQSLQEKCLNIITNKIQTIMSAIDTSVTYNEDPNMSEFADKVESELNAILTLKEKVSMLDKDISDIKLQKGNAIAEKNLEIEKLLKNSEVLSQEVTNKSKALKDVEDECAELVKNNDLLITELETYRKGSGLQTISESSEDNLLLLETQLENANTRIHELELENKCMKVLELENSKEDELEIELLETHLSTTSQELRQSKEEFSELLSHYKQLEEDKVVLQSTIDKTKCDFENVEYKYTELTINFDTLKEENEQLQHKHLELVTNFQNIVALHKALENEILLLQKSEQELNKKLKCEVENNEDKEIQQKKLVERLQNCKMSETSWKLQVDTLHKELQIVTEAKQAEILKYEQYMKDFEKQKQEFINQGTKHLASKIFHLEVQVHELTTSRDDLISLVKSKHEENLKYHDEIQRLNLRLSIEIERAALFEKQLKEVSVSQEEITTRGEEIQKLKEQNNILKEKSETLSQNLLQEQSNVQTISKERQSAVDRDVISSKELERLMQHLVEVEEVYTQELLQAEQKNTEMLKKVKEIEQREKESNSIYTSINIRANQQVEALQAQIQLATNQREDLGSVISGLEDKNNKQAAALTNLQLVLEQFQRDKKRDVEQETERIRRQIGVEKRAQEVLGIEVSFLKLQLDESKQGLQAASRLSEQLEKSKHQIYSCKEEILKLHTQLKASDNRCKELIVLSEVKVDKTLVKNLILGYLTSNPNDRRQILKVIATILDFDEKESEKANLNKPAKGGWLSTILNPQSLQPDTDGNQQSLAEAFVRFLENESKPKVVPNLLIATQQSQDNSHNGNRSRKQSHTLHEVVLPTFEEFGGSSRSSSAILKGILKNNH